MKTTLATSGHLAMTSSLLILITVALPKFTQTLMPDMLSTLLASKHIQIEWLNSLLQAMG